MAEVLITLGIIGVVAAMTMPILMTKYEKQVVSTRLKKFYSIYSQAANLSVNENSTMDDANILISPADPNQMLEWYNKYLKPYLKTLNVEKTNVGIEVSFLDGSGMLIAKSGCAPGAGCVHLLYCVNLKYCEMDGIKHNKNLDALADGKNTFLFYTGNQPVSRNIYEYKEDGTVEVKKAEDRNEALRLCKNKARNCTRLLLMDGWEIKDDYPW